MNAAAPEEAPPETRPRERLWIDGLVDTSLGAKTLNASVALVPAPREIGAGHALVLCDYGGSDGCDLTWYAGAAGEPARVRLPRPAAAIAALHTRAGASTPLLAIAQENRVLVLEGTAVICELALPAVATAPLELDEWSRALAAPDGPTAVEALAAGLRQVRETGNVALSSRARELLAVFGRDRAAADALLTELRQTAAPLPGSEPARVTALAALPREPPDDMRPSGAASLLLVGTEQGQLHILDATRAVFLDTIVLADAVAFLAVSGCYSGTYTIVAASRDGVVQRLGRNQSQTVAQVRSPLVDVLLTPALLVLALANRRIELRTHDGAQVCVLTTPAAPTALAPFALPFKGVNGFMVALADRSVQMYRDHRLVCAVPRAAGVPVALRFGQFGRQELCLVLVMRSGAVQLKVLRRAAAAALGSAEPLAGIVGNDDSIAAQLARLATPDHAVPLPVPKRSRAAVEWAERERAAAQSVHETCATRLLGLRVAAARELVALRTRATRLAHGADGALSLEPLLLGAGPVHKLVLRVSCAPQATGRPLSNVSVLLGPAVSSSGAWTADPALHRLPPLVPNRGGASATVVSSLFPSGVSDIGAPVPSGTIEALVFFNSRLVLRAHVAIPGTS